MNSSTRARTLLIAIAAPLFFVAIFVFVVVTYNNSHVPPQVQITPAKFQPQSIQISQDETIRFVNTSSTDQVLCIGSNQQCATTGIAVPPPSTLVKPGVRLAPGQSRDIAFPTSGTFHITSTAGPALNLTVTVNEGIA